MSPAADDWRRGNEQVLAGLTFTWKTYQAYSGYGGTNTARSAGRSSWTGTIPTGCERRLRLHPASTLQRGYTNVRNGSTPSGRHWVCRECFEDFLPEFGWEVVQSDADAWPYDTPEPTPRPTAADFDRQRSSERP